MAATPYRALYLLSSFISFLLFAYILNFLVKLESTGCACAMDWRRQYIMAYMAYMLVHTCIGIYALTAPAASAWMQFHAALAPLTVILGILFIVFTFQYVHRLEEEKCACSASLGRAIMTLVAAIDAAVFALMGLVLIASIIALMLGFGSK